LSNNINCGGVFIDFIKELVQSF